MTTLQRIIIVGNGIAGMTAADTLRAEGFDGQIVLVGDEAHAPYSRPALSKALLRSEEDLTSHLLPPPTHGAEELRGIAVRGLDSHSRTVLLEGGERLPFDGLVIATGCRPRRLGDGTPEGPDEVTVRTIDDALHLRRRIAERPRIVVIGGGPLGMELASGCVSAGCAVTLVNQGPPMQLQLGGYLSNLFTEAAVAAGLDVMNTEGASLVRIGDGTRVRLADGTLLDADLVITAVGDVPNVEWLEASGLLQDGALVADECGRVAPGIVAAGDAAAMPTPMGTRRVPLWSAAIEQSKTAAVALLREDAAPSTAKPYFWTEQFGMSLKAVGHLPLRGTPTVMDSEPDANKYLLRWDAAQEPGTGAAAAINYRIAIPKLRRLSAGDD